MLFAGLASDPTHFHHQGHTQLAQNPLTGHTLVISAVPVTHTPLVGRLCACMCAHACDRMLTDESVKSLSDLSRPSLQPLQTLQSHRLLRLLHPRSTNTSSNPSVLRPAPRRPIPDCCLSSVAFINLLSKSHISKKQTFFARLPGGGGVRSCYVKLKKKINWRFALMLHQICFGYSLFKLASKLLCHVNKAQALGNNALFLL